MEWALIFSEESDAKKKENFTFVDEARTRVCTYVCGKNRIEFIIGRGYTARHTAKFRVLGLHQEACWPETWGD